MALELDLYILLQMGKIHLQVSMKQIIHPKLPGASILVTHFLPWIIFSGHHHIIGTNLTRNKGECLCNNKNAGDEGGCNTLGLDPVRTGHAKYWCFVDPDSHCSDKKQSSLVEGQFYSFQACASNN